MKACWEKAGLSPNAAARADAALPLMLEAMLLAGSQQVAKLVMQEALLQYHDLPEQEPPRRRTGHIRRKRRGEPDRRKGG